MRATLALLALVFTTLASVTAVVRTNKEKLNEKVEMLNKMKRERPLFKMSPDDFKTYVQQKPRNYSVVVMLTALSPQRGCAACQQANDEYKILANSHRFASPQQQQGAANLYFAAVDYDGGHEIFEYLGIQSAPTFIHFPSKGKRKKADKYDVQRFGFNAEQLSKWVEDRSGVRVHVRRPVDHTGTVMFSLVLFMMAMTLYMKRNDLGFLASSSFWGYICIFVILCMLSGQMWNHIRGPPLFHHNKQTGQVQYIHGQAQSQLISETYIVFLLYAAISFGFILVVKAFESSKEEESRRAFMVKVGLGLVGFCFYQIMGIFGQKYRGYPYAR